MLPRSARNDAPEAECMFVFLNRTKFRYYRIEIGRDLFGQCVLIRRWGGLRNRLWGKKVEVLDVLQAERRLKALMRRLRRRGYLLADLEGRGFLSLVAKASCLRPPARFNPQSIWADD